MIYKTIFKFYVKLKNGSVIEWSKTKYDVLGHNFDFICIDDYRFTTLCINSEKNTLSDEVLEQACVCDLTDIKSLNYISLTLFSSSDSISNAQMIIQNKFNEYCSKKCLPYNLYKSKNIEFKEIVEV